MATHLEQSADLAIGNEANDGGGEGSGAEHASPAPAKAAPVRDVLSKVALALLAPKARSKPLSAQTDGFVLSTIGRLVDAHRDGEVSSAIAGADLRELLDEADRRALTKQLSAGTCTEAERIASIDDAAQPVDVEQSIDVHVEASAHPGELRTIRLNLIDPDPDQPRVDVDDELADSIAAQGVRQPIVVREHPVIANIYMIVDGERRYRGALKAKLETIPARVVYDADDDGDRLLQQVTFNEGKRLAPMEEAKAWARIMDAKGWTIQQLASALGRAKSTVSDRLAMLEAPAPFVKYFTDGVLTAAAAPVVRRFAGIDETTAKRIVDYATTDSDWEAAVNNGTPVPLKIVERALNEAACDELRTVDPRVGYTGPTVTIENETLALDSARYEEQDEAFWEQQQASAPEPTKREPSSWEIESRERQRKERIAHEKKRVLRRAQFDAISPKLPATLDGNWALLLITWLTKEIQQDYQRVFLKALDIEPTKRPGQYGGFDFQGTIIREAEKLAAPARVKFALALLMAHDLNVSSYDTGGADRLAAAAKLLKVDLSKVKAPDSDKTKKPAAKKAAKKGGRR